MTELLTAWEEISRAYEEIGERDVRRVQRNLNKMSLKETPLGAIHNESLKRLWALADKYRTDAVQALLDTHKADADEQAEGLRKRANRLIGLEEVVRSLFWIQAKDDIGAWNSSGNTGLRADWMLVHAEQPLSPIGEILSDIFRRPE